MEKNVVNPWKWQDNFGYAQAVEVKNNKGTLYCSGQAAMNVEGVPSNGSMREQVELSLVNLEKVIEQAGYMPSGIVRLNLYTTSIADLFPEYGTIVTWLHKHHCTPTSTLVEVKALAFPSLTIEIEATVVS